MKRFLPLFLAGLSAQLTASPARAHGTIPTCVSLGWLPSGQLFVGTNFGGLSLRTDAGLDFTCELAVTGTQQALDIWWPLPSGRVAAVSTTSGATFGIYLSDEAGCTFDVVPGSEDLLVTDLHGDEETLFATGFSGRARLVSASETGLEVLHEDVAREATGVRVDGGDVVAVFVGDDARIVHLREGTKTLLDHPLEERSTLRPLGFSGGLERQIWFVERRDDVDRVLVSNDFGQSLELVETFAGRIGGFASRGEEVFLQSPQLGVLRLKEGRFEALRGSPHGSALAFDPKGELHACGVPWQDGMVVGNSRDFETFEAVVPMYDALQAPRVCPDAPEVTDTCGDELAFIRGYYGFSPSPGGEVEVTPEEVESLEQPEVAEPDETVEPKSGGGEGGCAGGLTPSALWVGLVLFGRVRRYGRTVLTRGQ
jgi:hypothetical protein